MFVLPLAVDHGSDGLEHVDGYLAEANGDGQRWRNPADLSMLHWIRATKRIRGWAGVTMGGWLGPVRQPPWRQRAARPRGCGDAPVVGAAEALRRSVVVASASSCFRARVVEIHICAHSDWKDEISLANCVPAEVEDSLAKGRVRVKGHGGAHAASKAEDGR
ncbi:hypothetical protein ZWY2020_005804 [Hordeum vulgare]|nr:hypothetical protein ZWY2020_005804 [Hordeum vulgare]